MTAEDDLQQLSELVRERREARGISARKAADLAGISDAMWRQVEKGYRQVTPDIRVPVHPSAKTLRAMAPVIGSDPALLLQLGGREADEGGDPVERNDPLVAAILQDKRLLPEAKAHFLNQFRLLLRIQGPSTDADVQMAYERRLAEELAAQPDPGEDELGSKRKRRRPKTE